MVPRAATAPRASAIVDRLLALSASLLTASMLVSALHDVSQAWDVGYYHLPFAARIGGVLPPDVYVFRALDEARFSGFPLLAEALQGILWRVTGRAEATNLVAFAAVPILAWLLRRRFGVPMHVALLAFFAVPLVQLHATSSYVDLPANAAVTALVLLTLHAWAEEELVSARTWGLALLAGGAAANIKALAHPMVALALVALFVRAVLAVRATKESPLRARAKKALFVVPLLAPLVFATPLANVVRHGNPYYPITTSVLGHALPGLEAPYDSSPEWLESSPRPVRFVCSLLEMGIRPMTSRRRWTIDQWMPQESGGNRMGGFFHAYVLFNVAWLAWRVRRDRSRTARVAGLGFLAVTVVTSCMPQSHELRYYMDWMLVLVSLNLWLTRRGDDEGRLLTTFGVLATSALLVVLVVTRFGYVLPTGETFAELVAEKVDAGALANVADGEHICVDRPPWTLLWAAPFHAPRRYVVKEAEEAGDCASFRPVP